MKNTATIILILITCFPAFARQLKHRKYKSQNEITSVTMQRTACYGRCPVYSIELNNTGMVTYTAVRFNDDSGVFTKNIGMEKTMNVFGQFNTYKADTCQDTYTNRIMDLPGIIFTIRYKKHIKKIQNAQFGPPFLKRLAEIMDENCKKKDDSWTMKK